MEKISGLLLWEETRSLVKYKPLDFVESKIVGATILYTVSSTAFDSATYDHTESYRHIPKETMPLVAAGLLTFQVTNTCFPLSFGTSLIERILGVSITVIGLTVDGGNVGLP